MKAAVVCGSPRGSSIPIYDLLSWFSANSRLETVDRAYLPLRAMESDSMLGLLHSLVGLGKGFPCAFISRMRARAALRRPSSSRLESLVEVFGCFRVIFLMALKVVQGSIDLKFFDFNFQGITQNAFFPKIVKK